MSGFEIQRLEWWRQFVIMSAGRRKRRLQVRDVLGGRLDPKVDIFRKSRGSVQNRGLPTDQQICDAANLKVSEKACNHEQLEDRASVCAKPMNGEDALPESTGANAPI